MRGSPLYQVNQVFDKVISYGKSKHEAKEQAREIFEAQNKNLDWHEMGKNLDVYSFATADQYRMVARDMLEFARQEYGVKDIEKIDSGIINSYLESKIEKDIKYSTFLSYAAALEKLEVALNSYAEVHNTGKVYEFDLSNARQEAQLALEKTDASRAYENPKNLIENINDKTFKTLATAQLEGGFRVSELNRITEKNFANNNVYRVIDGKGGKNREVQLNSETYNSLKNLVNAAGGKLIFNMDSYRSTLREAAAASGQEYTGSHGLRWNFAQEKFTNLQAEGKTYEQSLQIVSNLLGHERADVTEHYLK